MTKRRRKRPRKRPERKATAKTLLGSKDLDAALRICCALSVFSAFKPDWSAYWVPTYIHYPLTRLLVLRVLASDAQHGSPGVFTVEGISALVNACKRDFHNPALLEGVTDRSPRFRLELQRFMAVLGNLQISHAQTDPRLWVSRLIGMISTLPVRERAKIPPDRVAVVDEVLAEIPRELGADVARLGLLHFFLQLYYREFFQRYLTALMPRRTEEVDPATQLSALFTTALHYAEQERPIEIPLSKFAAEVPIEAYLRLFARTVEELRQEDQGQQYAGHPSSRLSAIDRYPVVRLPRPSIIVPEVTVHAKSFPFVIDFSLVERLDRQKYDEFRGAMQELYLRCLLEDRIPGCVVVPERKYGKQHYSGPDLTILEGDRLIVVESKARRLSPAVVTGMSDESIDQNLEDAYPALLRLPQKIRHLYQGLPNYADVQAAIDRTKGTQPICVVVIGGSAVLLAELVRQRIEDPASPLYQFNLPFCVVSLESFENAVEIARDKNLPLSQLLEEHAEAAAKADPNTPMADMWGGRRPPEFGERFVSRFLSDRS